MADRLVWSGEMKGRLANAVIDFKRFNRTGDEKRNSFKTQEWSDIIKRYNDATTDPNAQPKPDNSFRKFETLVLLPSFTEAGDELFTRNITTIIRICRRIIVTFNDIGPFLGFEGIPLFIACPIKSFKIYNSIGQATL